MVYNLDKLVRIQLIKCQFFSMREAKYSWTVDKDEKGNQIHREPDFSILCGVQKRDNSTYTDVPRFIAEILSDSTEKDDRGEKMNLYLKVGVEEIWLIDPRILTIERYILDDDGKSFLLHDIIKKTDDGKIRNNIRPLLFPQLLIPYDDIFMGVSVDQ